MLITNCLIDGIAEFRVGGLNPTLITLGTRTYENIKEEGRQAGGCVDRDGKEIKLKPIFMGIKIKVSDNRYEMRVT